MRFFVCGQNAAGDIIVLPESDAAHIARVLRMRPGQHIVVCDDGLEHDCELVGVGKDGVTARVVSSRSYSTEPDVDVTVFAALSKGERFDYLIQKCVEVGATAIVPFLSERCVVRPSGSDCERKQVRFARIALEASKQALRSRPVTVTEIVSFEKALQMAAEYPAAMLLYEKENRRSLRTYLNEKKGCVRYAVMTGPEGGFTEQEAEQARESGLESISIGPRILRCETAPVAAVCSIMYHTGNYDIGE